MPYPVKNPALVATIDMGWQLKAECCGYTCPFSMLKHLYTYEELTDRQIGILLDKSDRTITSRRKKYGIKSRPQGGANNKKKKESTTWPFRCKKCGDTLYGDQRKVGLCVFCDPGIGFSALSAEDVKVIY